MVCITGVSGAGKTTLVHNILYAGAKGNGNSEFEKGAFYSIEGLKQVNDLILVDQSPIWKSLRSNPATYIKVFSDIRDLFAHTREAKRYGLKPRHFSFNTHVGACPACTGLGERWTADPALLVDHPERPLVAAEEGAPTAIGGKLGRYLTKGKGYYEHLLRRVAASHQIDLERPFRSLAKAAHSRAETT